MFAGPSVCKGRVYKETCVHAKRPSKARNGECQIRGHTASGAEGMKSVNNAFCTLRTPFLLPSPVHLALYTPSPCIRTPPSKASRKQFRAASKHPLFTPV